MQLFCLLPLCWLQVSNIFLFHFFFFFLYFSRFQNDFSVFFLTIFVITLFSLSIAFDVNKRMVLYIDCGGGENFKDWTSPSKVWVSDRYFIGGVPTYLSISFVIARQLSTIFSFFDGKKTVICYRFFSVDFI